MSIDTDIGIKICESIDTIVKERLKSINFDSTLTCVITDDSQSQYGTYIVSDGSVKFTAYSSVLTYKVDDQVYVSIPNNDFSEQKMIIGKKKNNDDKVPYSYQSPFATFIKGTDNLIDQGAKNYYSLRANQLSYTDNDDNFVPQASAVTIPVIKNLPVTEIPYTRLGIKADFKSLLPDSTTYGEYGLVVYINNNEEPACALDSKNDMYGNPYQLFTYTGQEMVFVIDEAITEINSLQLKFYENGNFNGLDSSKSDYDFGWIADWAGIDYNIDPNLFTTDIELYLGYDESDFLGDKFEIFDSEKNYQYDYKTDEINTRIIQGEWVHINSISGETELLTANNHLNCYVRDQVMLKTNKFTSMIYWYKETDGDEKARFQGIRWYRRKYGAPSPDNFAGQGWEVISPNIENPFAVPMVLDNNAKEESFKAIIFDNLTFSSISYEGELVEGIETIEESENKEKTFYYTISGGSPIVSNTLTYSNIGYESAEPINKQNQLSIITTDTEDGNYYIYSLMGEIINDTQLKQERKLEPYYEGVKLNKSNPYKLEWIVPYRKTMFNPQQYKILDKKIDEFNTTDLNITVVDLNINKKEVINSELVYFKKIIIDNLDEGFKNNDEVNIFDLTYQISQSYDQNNVNNIIDCKVYRPYDNVPYTTSRKFNFGLGSTSGTEVVVKLLCEKYNVDKNTNIPKFIGSNPIINLNQNSSIIQEFRITPKIILSKNNTEIKIDGEQVTCKWSWYGRETDPECFSNIEPEGFNRDDNVATDLLKLYVEAPQTKDDYVVLQATIKYGDYYNLTVYLPFAFAGKINETEFAEIPDGPFELIYDSASGLPLTTSKMGIPYNIDNLNKEAKWIIQKFEQNEWNNIWPNDQNKEIGFYPSIDKTNNLIPAKLFVDNLGYISVKCSDVNNIVYWSQPLLILKNKFPNTIINNWDGKFIIDEEENTILSAMIVAGSKDPNNNFTGIIMGNIQGGSDSSLQQHGLYGYNTGEQIYAFKEDGTGFIGKNGQGRIEFDGNSSIIKSSNYDIGSGMAIDLDNNQLVSRSVYFFGSLPEIQEYLRLIALIRMVAENELTQAEDLLNTKRNIVTNLYKACCDNSPQNLSPLQQMEQIMATKKYELFLRRAEPDIKRLIEYYSTYENEEGSETAEPIKDYEGLETSEKTCVLKEFKEDFNINLEIVVNGEYEENGKVLAIGPANDPSFSVDWEGNTTIKGDFKILNKSNQTVLEITEEKIEFNLFDNQLKDQNERLKDLENKNYKEFQPTENIALNEEGLTIGGSTLKTTINPGGLSIKETREEKDQLIVDSNGVKAKDLYASTYLRLGEHMRLEEYTAYPNNEREIRIGCFWVG